MSLLTGLVTADLGRQRRAMQAELTDKVKALEEEVSRLKEELGKSVGVFFLPPSSRPTHGSYTGYDNEVMPKCICLPSTVPGGAVKGEEGARAEGRRERIGPGRPATQA